MNPNVDSLAAMRRRRERAPAGDATTGFFFQSLVEAVKARRGEAAVAPMLAAAGLKGRWLGLLRYPASDYLRLMEAALLAMGPEEELAANMLRLGSDAAETFRASPVGQVFERANAGAVHRVMAGVRLAYASTSSFGERSYDRVSEREGLLRVRGDWVGPGVALGVIQGGVPVLTSTSIQAAAEAVEDDGTRYAIRVRW